MCLYLDQTLKAQTWLRLGEKDVPSLLCGLLFYAILQVQENTGLQEKGAHFQECAEHVCPCSSECCVSFSPVHMLQKCVIFNPTILGTKPDGIGDICDMLMALVEEFRRTKM